MYECIIYELYLNKIVTKKEKDVNRIYREMDGIWEAFQENGISDE